MFSTGFLTDPLSLPVSVESELALLAFCPQPKSVESVVRMPIVSMILKWFIPVSIDFTYNNTDRQKFSASFEHRLSSCVDTLRQYIFKLFSGHHSA